MSKTLALEASRREHNAKEKSLQMKIEQLEMISQHLKPNHASFMDQLQDQVELWSYLYILDKTNFLVN